MSVRSTAAKATTTWQVDVVWWVQSLAIFSDVRCLVKS